MFNGLCVEPSRAGNSLFGQVTVRITIKGDFQDGPYSGYGATH